MIKTKYLKIRVSEAELSKLKQLAENNGLTVSAYIRHLVAREENNCETNKKLAECCQRRELERGFGYESI